MTEGVKLDSANFYAKIDKIYQHWNKVSLLSILDHKFLSICGFLKLFTICHLEFL